MINCSVITVILTLAVSAVTGQTVCNSADNADGLGKVSYLYHETRCNEFIQCHNDESGNVFAVYMACPYGQHWNQVIKTCVDITPTSCSLGICDSTARLEHGGCRAYSLCPTVRTNTHHCCDVGERYMGGKCVPDHTCTDPCPGECTGGEICRSYPHWSNPTFYYHYHAEEGKHYERICPKGSHFDMLECGCVAPRRQICLTKNALRFTNGVPFTQSGIWTAETPIAVTDSEASFDSSNSILRGDITLGQATEEAPLVIRLGYRRFNVAPTTQFQTIFLSNDCKRCNQLRIGIQNDQFIVTLSKDNQDVAEISLHTLGFNNSRLVDAAVVYNGRELLAVIRSGNLYTMKRTQAPQMKVMDCGMQISDEGNRFRGRLQYVAIYTCHQGGRVQSLFNLPTFPVN